MCKVKQLNRVTLILKSTDKKPQDNLTIINVIRFRIKQEIKLLYRKKYQLNQRLYHLHLVGAHQYNGIWQNIQEYIDEQINNLMDNLHQKVLERF